MTPPLIGITTERAEPDPVFSMEGYTVESELYRAVAAAGGIPVALPANCEALPAFIDRLDGIVFSGGGYAMPPEWYGADGGISPYGESPRFGYSLRLLHYALDRCLPVLGICAGMQLIAGAHGARLVPDLTQCHAGADIHWQVNRQATCAHRIEVKPGSLLAKLLGDCELGVNSIHREAVAECPESLSVCAISEDGVIEGCELQSYPFCLGLQWHPEHMAEDRQRHTRVFDGLIEAASQRAA